MKHALIVFALSVVFIGAAAFAQDFLREDNVFLTEKKLGFYDLFTMTTEERTAQNLGVTEDLNKPKASVDGLMERFVSNCLAQPADHAQEEKIKEFLCLCTAAKTTEYMEPEDIRTMFSIQKEARHQQERMFGLAVLPCTEKPADYLLQDKCAQDSFLRSRTTQVEKACACVGQDVAATIIKQNMKHFAELNEPVEDFLHRLVKNSLNGYAYETARKSCSYKH